jgi:hypothetical protein
MADVKVVFRELDNEHDQTRNTYQAECTCGYRGPLRIEDEFMAKADVRLHRRSHSLTEEVRDRY